MNKKVALVIVLKGHDFSRADAFGRRILGLQPPREGFLTERTSLGG
jgi:hypothetical protein